MPLYLFGVDEMNVQMLKAKKRLLVLKHDNGSLNQAIFCPTKVLGNIVKLGDFYPDEIKGWFYINDVADSVVSVVREFECDDYGGKQNHLNNGHFGR